MKENKKDSLDELFKRNSDYLANEPHPDFDPEAFWKELRPELSQTKTRKVAWWWQAAAAAVVLLLGGIGWVQLTSTEVPQTAVKPNPSRPVVASAEPEKEAYSTQSTPKEFAEKLAKPEINVAKAAPRPVPAAEIIKESIAPEGELPTGREPDRIVQVPQSVETGNAIQEVAGEAIKKPAKPIYRIVHLNELRKPKIQESQGRSRVAFRIGATADAFAPVVTTPTPQLTISIQPQ